jgi:hypothetical protein
MDNLIADSRRKTSGIVVMPNCMIQDGAPGKVCFYKPQFMIPKQWTVI